MKPNIKKYETNTSDVISDFLIESDIDLTNTSDYYVKLCIGGNSMAYTNIFHRLDSGNKHYYVCDFFVNDVVIPCNKLQYHKINIQESYKNLDFFYTTSDELNNKYMITSENTSMINMPLVYHQLPLNIPFIIEGDFKEKKIYPNCPDCHNVLRIVDGMCGLGYYQS